MCSRGWDSSYEGGAFISRGWPAPNPSMGAHKWQMPAQASALPGVPDLLSLHRRIIFPERPGLAQPSLHPAMPPFLRLGICGLDIGNSVATVPAPMGGEYQIHRGWGGDIPLSIPSLTIKI